MDGLKNITQFNTGSTIANGMKLSETAVALYKAAIDGLSLSQAQAALSSTALTDAQKEQILVSAGLLQSTEAITLEEIKQLASSASLSAQKKEEILTTLQGAYSENEWNREKLEAIANSGGEAGAIAQSILAKKAENAENIKGVASSKALTASLWAQLKARLALLAANPAAWIAGAIALGAGLVAIQKKLTKSLEECTEELDKNNSAFDEAQSEAESLQSEWETCQKRLAELQKLADNGTISIIEQEEYDRLLKTNDELERNIRIQKEKAQLSAIDAVNSADETLNKTVESKYVTVNAQDSQGVELTQTAWITPKEELNASIEEYKRLQTEIDRLKVSYDNGSISAEDYNTQLTDLTNQQTNARNRASEMSDILVESEQAYTNLTNTGAELTETQTANYNSVKQANAAYNDFLGTINGVDAAFENLDTTEKAQSLKNKYAAKKVSLPKGQGSYTVEDKEISNWIDTLSDEDLTVLASINFSGEQTKESMQEALDYAKNNVDGNTDETSILSFSDAWEQLKNSTEDATKGLADDLTKLAEAGQLTSEALSKADTSEFFKKAGITAEEATNQINALISASTQLQSMSAQISKMSDMLADKKKGNAASASDLAGFDATVKGLESWEEFERVMGSSKSSMEECQAATNALATEWVNNGNFLANLTEENKDYYITQLDNMGVMNAEALVTDRLSTAQLVAQNTEKALSAATTDLSDKQASYTQRSVDAVNATYENSTALATQEGMTNAARIALVDLVAEQTIFSNQDLGVTDKIAALGELAGAYMGAAAQASFLAKTQGGLNSYERISPEEAWAQVKDEFSKLDTTIVTPVIKPTGSSNYKPSGSSGGSGSGSDTKQTIDWIDRKLSVLRSNIDTTKTKFENLFNINSPKNLSKKIKSVTKELKDARKETSNWKSKLDKINISDSLKKQIQSGKKINLSKYSKSERKAIKSYQTNWSGYKSSLSNENKLISQLENLNSQRGKKQNLDTQIKQMRELQKADAKAFNAYQKKANSVKLSKALKDKVKSGDYKIEDYSSDTQALIQEYQGYIDKIRELETEKETLKGDIKDAKIEQYQLDADNASDKIEKSQAYAELDSGNYKEQNKHLEAQKKYIKEQYKALIQIAKLKGDTLEVDRLRAEKQKELNDLTKQEFDNISNTYDNKIGVTNNKIQAFQDQISLLEAQGQKVGSALYTKQMSLNNVNEKKLVTEREKLIAKLEGIPKNTDDWYDAVDTLFAVDGKLTQIQIDNANLQRSINQLKFDRFDDLLTKLNDIVDETDFLIDMLDSDNFFDDNGKITDDGITAMGMYAQKYDVYLAEAQKYKEQMAELERDYQSGNVDPETYEAKMREYKNGQQDMIKSANDAKKSLISLVKEGLDAQNEALEEAIQKQKDLLSEQQKARNLNQTLEDQNKRIARLKKQLAVLDADSSESARKTKRELQSELDDLLKEQENTLYDQSIEDQEKSLDELLENSEKQASDYLKNSEVVFVDALNKVNANTETVSKNIERISKETGVDISENITNAWKQSGNAVSDFGTTVSSTMPGVLSQISLVTEQMRQLAEESEKAAKSLVKDTVDDYTDYTSIGADNNGSSSQSNTGAGTSSVLGAASPVTGNIIGGVLTGMQMANKTAIASFISNNKKDPVQGTKYASLNQYLLKKYGGVLSKSDEAKLADMLGVKISSRALTGEQGRKDLDRILAALKNIGFSTGGVIDPHDILKRTGEKGYIIANPHEAVLTEPQWESIKDLGTALTNLNQPLYKPYIPEFQTRNTQSPVYNIDNSITVDGVATNEIVKDMANVAKKQAENVITEINRRTYAKGVRWK